MRFGDHVQNAVRRDSQLQKAYVIGWAGRGCLGLAEHWYRSRAKAMPQSTRLCDSCAPAVGCADSAID